MQLTLYDLIERQDSLESAPLCEYWKGCDKPTKYTTPTYEDEDGECDEEFNLCEDHMPAHKKSSQKPN